MRALGVRVRVCECDVKSVRKGLPPNLAAGRKQRTHPPPPT